MTSTVGRDVALKTVTVEDLPKLARCAAGFAAATKHVHRFEFSRFCDVWKAFIETGIGVIFALVDGEGNAVGMLGGIANQELYSTSLVASEFFWYVLPEYRGSGMPLYHQFEKWAEGKGCAEIRMAGLADSMPEKLDRLYHRMGFEPVERHYAKEL